MIVHGSPTGAVVGPKPRASHCTMDIPPIPPIGAIHANGHPCVPPASRLRCVRCWHNLRLAGGRESFGGQLVKCAPRRRM